MREAREARDQTFLHSTVGARIGKDIWNNYEAYASFYFILSDSLSYRLLMIINSMIYPVCRVPCQRYIWEECLYNTTLSTFKWQKTYFLPREKLRSNIWVYGCLHLICLKGNSSSNLSVQTTLKRDLSVWCDASMIFLKSFSCKC